MADTRARSIAKSLSWRATATATTMVIVLRFTGELHLAVAVGGVEVFAKLAIFYAHERVWQRLRWGVE
jgi:adenylylsulfate kinase